MKNNINKYITGCLLALIAIVFASCEEVEYPQRSEKNTVGQIYINVKVPQIDPAKIVYKAVYGVIDEANGKIVFDVPYNLSEVVDDVTDISQVYIIASVPVSSIITPGLGGLIDMTNPMPITVTAANGAKKDYVLEAKLKKSDAKSITSFKFSINEYAFTGISNEDTHKVTYMVANPDIKEVIAANKAIPEFIVSPRAKIISPDITQPMDFSQDVMVQVEAQDGSIQEWTIVQSDPKLLPYGFGYTRKKWSLSADEMGFGGSLDYRGMTATANYVIVSARDFGCLMFDKETGASKGKVALPADLDASNKAASMYVTTDAAGKLAACSFTSWTTASKFVVYYWKNGETSAPVRLFEEVGLGDCGRKFSVAGDLSGNAFIYATKGKGNSVYRFTIEGGVYKGFKTITVTEPNATFTYLCAPIPLDNTEDSQFILVDQVATGMGSVSIHNANGSMIAQMTNGAKCMGDGVTADGKCFTFNNARYMLYVDQNATATKGAMRIYDITNIADFGMAATHPNFTKFFVFKSEFMNSTTNGNGTGAVAYDLSPDGETVDVYLMLTNGGVMRYELTKIAID